MANVNEIKTRIQSVQDTSKITNAMYLISSTKLQKAKRNLEKAKPYFHAMHHEVERVFCWAENTESRYFFSPKREKESYSKVGCLVITADKGLAGSYNANVIKKAEQMLKKHPDTKLYVIGDYGRHYFDRHGISYERGFEYAAQQPTLKEARTIGDILLDEYDRGVIDRVYVIYTDMRTALSSETRLTRVLPFERADFLIENNIIDKSLAKRFEFFPSADEVLDHAVRSLTVGFIYGALVYSFCSEQNARMTAMDSANKNAEKILSELKLKYNRVRQAAITQEITEISAGELAQKRKKLNNVSD